MLGSDQAETVRAFLAATAKGYQHAAQQPEAAAALLCKTVTEEKLDVELVQESMQMLSQVCSMLTHSEQCWDTPLMTCTLLHVISTDDIGKVVIV